MNPLRAICHSNYNFFMFRISDKAWREAVEIAEAYSKVKVDCNDLRAVNRVRRAKLLVKQLRKATKL